MRYNQLNDHYVIPYNAWRDRIHVGNRAGDLVTLQWFSATSAFWRTMFFTINVISCCDSRCENNNFYLFYLFIMNFTETFPCMSSPCHHGNCYEGTGSFYCACELGYTGDACESCKLILISFLMRILKTEEYYCPMSRGEWDLGRGL